MSSIDIEKKGAKWHLCDPSMFSNSGNLQTVNLTFTDASNNENTKAAIGSVSKSVDDDIPAQIIQVDHVVETRCS